MNDVARMADEKHTPGPWKVIPPGHGHPSEYQCVQFGANEMYTSLEVLPADARLIAAAPDLYATLNDVLDSFDRQTMEEMLRKDNDAHDDDEFCVNLTAKQLRAINQAILKVEGKV